RGDAVDRGTGRAVQVGLVLPVAVRLLLGAVPLTLSGPLSVLRFRLVPGGVKHPSVIVRGERRGRTLEVRRSSRVLVLVTRLTAVGRVSLILRPLAVLPLLRLPLPVLRGQRVTAGPLTDQVAHVPVVRGVVLVVGVPVGFEVAVHR